jgi:hypothetical protein
MKILSIATKAAHTVTLQGTCNVQPYTRYPVFESEFWETIFKFSKKPEAAQQVIDELSEIEQEPCINNERVWRNVRAAKATAKLTLLKNNN